MNTPNVEPAKDGTIRRKPDSVADSRRTAWKKSGMLKRMLLMRTAPKKLEKMRLARGEVMMMRGGIMGNETWFST